MPGKAYISNILKVWSPETQQELLDGVGERLTIYQDELRPGERKRKAADAMVQRDAMFRPTGRRNREETVYVACLGLLAWDLRDLQRCLRAAQARGATIVALNTGRRIAPDAGAKETDEAQDDFTADKRRGAVRPGRLGHEIAREQRLADTARRLDLIREDWGNPAFNRDELLMRAGRKTKRGHIQPMAYITARTALGVRSQIFKMKAGRERARAKRAENQK
jgi:hypothetical protein